MRSTLKITSAMKLVASSKLRKAQNAIETLRPYEEALKSILASASSGVQSAVPGSGSGVFRGSLESGGSLVASGSGRLQVVEGAVGATRLQGAGSGWETDESPNRVAIVAISSNSSLCGGFNANVIRKTLEVAADSSVNRALGNSVGNGSGSSVNRVSGNSADKASSSSVNHVSGNSADGKGAGVTVYSLGRKMADAMKKAGYVSPADYNSLVGRPVYDDIRSLAEELSNAYEDGRFDRIILVYNHFVSTSKQVAVVEQYLPFEIQLSSGPESALESAFSSGSGNAPESILSSGLETAKGSAPSSESGNVSGSAIYSGSNGVSEFEDKDYYLFEPDAGEIVKELLPKVLSLKLFAAVLDSAAAEHAARTVAMQTATDNAQELLSDLTLEYNKGRQQKITAEILDLVGGAQ